MSCEDCTEEREFTNLSVGFSKILTRTVNEGMLFLKTAGCSTNQITAMGNIDPLGGVFPVVSIADV